MLLTRDPQASIVSVTWALTEDGNDETTTGELTLETSEPADAAELLKTIFLPDD